MRRLLLIALSALSAACGGEAPDLAPPFAGVWFGTATTTDSTGAELGTDSVAVNLEETSRSIVKFYNACIEENGPYLQVTSNTAFASLAAYTCHSQPNDECGTIVVTWESVTGSLTGSTLNFTAKLTGVLCGDTITFGTSFSGTH